MITVVDTYKPNRVTATATATIDVRGTHTHDEVIDAGLSALHETRRSLFGYGITEIAHQQPVSNTTVTVYAYRD